jgi:hypothetical protein
VFSGTLHCRTQLQRSIPPARNFYRINMLGGIHTSGSRLDMSGRERTHVQRHIELLIGRLVTDEDFRSAFTSDPRQALADAERYGLTLNAIEVEALLSTDRLLWVRIASEVDSRLQKASFSSESSS